MTDVLQQFLAASLLHKMIDKSVSGWLIVELGDGQVAGLPERADVCVLLRAG